MNGTGQLQAGMEGVVRIPYHLHLIHDLPAVIIVEGEQCADALLRAGYPATTNPGGSSKWQPELSQHFAGKDVTIIPDNDDPGRKHALNTAEALHPIAKSVRIANLCEDLNDKDDIVDWMQQHHRSIGKIWQEIARFPAWNPGDEIESGADYDIWQNSAAAWRNKSVPPRDYLLGTVLCTTSRWMIYAPTGLGKTLFAMNMTAAIAAGERFLGWNAGRRCRVLYIDGEMPVETFKERIVQATDLFPSDGVFGINRDNETTENREMPPLNTDDGLVWIRDKIKKYKPDLIVFDSIMCLLSGDMKDEETWEPVKILMKEMSNQRIAQIWIHHTGHDAGRSYGTSTREWELDTVLKLERPPSNEAERSGV